MDDAAAALAASSDHDQTRMVGWLSTHPALGNREHLWSAVQCTLGTRGDIDDPSRQIRRAAFSDRGRAVQETEIRIRRESRIECGDASVQEIRLIPVGCCWCERRTRKERHHTASSVDESSPAKVRTEE